jgi:hypothetical protein
MKTITITLTAEEAQRIANALNLQAVNFSGQSETVGVDCMHPDFFHDEWNKVNRVWLQVYNAIHPETEKED